MTGDYESTIVSNHLLYFAHCDILACNMYLYYYMYHSVPQGIGADCCYCGG